MSSRGGDILDDLIHKPDDQVTLKDVLMGIRAMRDDFNVRFEKIEEKIGEIDTVREDLESLKEDFEETKLVVSLAAAEDAFPLSVSLLITNMPQAEDEDNDTLIQAVDDIFRDGLELQDIEIHDLHRIPPRSYADVAGGADGGAPREARPGLVKVRVGSQTQKITCLRNKRKLNPKTPYKKV